MGNVKWLESFRYMHTHRSPPQSTTDHEALANLSARCAYTTHAGNIHEGIYLDQLFSVANFDI
jgi:hypothetical protein